ncbi:MAG TPA: hypothetical protein VLT84_09195, partial [Acidobacteriota bacterium]|nr:hypothetical protein [Acidobacteriota bacterium]
GPYRPVANDDGRWIPMIVETNRERVSRDGRFFPAHVLDTGRLAHGREPAPGVAWTGAAPSRAYDPAAEWFVDREGRTIEIAIPWGLLGVGDPSSRAVIDDRDGTSEVETTVTPGIALLAWATSGRGARADSLGPAEPGARDAAPGDVTFLGPAGTTQFVEGKEVRVSTPTGRLVVWNGWDVPITEERVKTSARFVREAFEGMESRETKNSSVGRRP